MTSRLASFCFALWLAVVPAAGQDGAATGATGVLRLLPPDSVTQQRIDVPGGALDYTATAGTLPLFDPSGEQKASVFYVAYRMNGTDPANRPITFVFNGGPGAAATYLHLGLVGPRRVTFGPTGRDGANAQLRDNPETWLRFTDLVMIDPIGTGWSRTARPDDAKAYWNVRADADVIAKTIALYVARNGRTASAKYLLGESYGGYRAAKVARALQEGQSIVVSGILMVSPLLEAPLHFGSAERFALGCALQLPSVAASELEWRRTYSDEALASAERFAMTEYLTTLAGAPPRGDRARAFYGRIAEMTGLPVAAVAKAGGCIRDEYLKHRRDTEGEILSVYDGTIAAPDPFPDSARRRGGDPVLDGFTRALGSAFVGYARDELGFRTDMTYSLLASDIAGRWDWNGGRNQASASDDLRELLALNAGFRLLVSHGVSDLVIPYAVSRYVVDHLPQADEADRAMLRVYRGGHMFYLRDDSRIAFSAEAKAFYETARRN